MPLQGSVYVFNIPAQSAPGTIRYRIYAEDSAGKRDGSGGFSFTGPAGGGGAPPRAPPSDPPPLIAAAMVVVAVVLAVMALLMRRRRKGPPMGAETPPKGE